MLAADGFTVVVFVVLFIVTVETLDYEKDIFRALLVSNASKCPDIC